MKRLVTMTTFCMMGMLVCMATDIAVYYSRNDVTAIFQSYANYVQQGIGADWSSGYFKLQNPLADPRVFNTSPSGTVFWTSLEGAGSLCKNVTVFKGDDGRVYMSEINPMSGNGKPTVTLAGGWQSFFPCPPTVGGKLTTASFPGAFGRPPSSRVEWCPSFVLRVDTRGCSPLYSPSSTLVVSVMVMRADLAPGEYQQWRPAATATLAWNQSGQTVGFDFSSTGAPLLYWLSFQERAVVNDPSPPTTSE